MNPTQEWLDGAEKCIRLCLRELRPKLLKAQGGIEHNLKDDKSVVTAMDLLVEDTLKTKLLHLHPSVGFGGEERGVDYDQNTLWLVVPIDGTEYFTRGLPFATNMLAWIDDGQPIMGIIYNFSLDEYF